MKIKVCYLISFVEFSQQLIDLDECLDDEKYQITYVFLSPKIPALAKVFEAKSRGVHFVKYSGKQNIPAAVLAVLKIFSQIKPDIVHTHLVDASLAGLIAAKIKRIKNTVQTRHHSVENYVYYPHAVRYDKLNNFLSGKIIAVSGLVAEVLTERDKAERDKVKIIEHGFNFDNYAPSIEKIDEMKKKYGLNDRYPIVGVISRFVHWKGIQYTIPAFRKLTEKYPKAKLVLANAVGSYAEEIETLLRENLEESQFVQIKFEKNFVELYKLFDIFAHVPINREFEAFGQVYIEALALNVPSVFTLSGIAADFIKDRENALVVPYENAEAIYEALDLLLSDEDLRNRIVIRGEKDVRERFHIKRMARKIDLLYSGF